MIEFEAELELDGKTATGITVPPEVVDALGGGKRPQVRVTINAHTYPSTIGTIRGVAKIPVSAAVRQAAGESLPGTVCTFRLSSIRRRGR